MKQLCPSCSRRISGEAWKAGRLFCGETCRIRYRLEATGALNAALGRMPRDLDRVKAWHTIQRTIARVCPTPQEAE